MIVVGFVVVADFLLFRNFLEKCLSFCSVSSNYIIVIVYKMCGQISSLNRGSSGGFKFMFQLAIILIVDALGRFLNFVVKVEI